MLQNAFCLVTLCMYCSLQHAFVDAALEILHGSFVHPQTRHFLTIDEYIDEVLLEHMLPFLGNCKRYSLHGPLMPRAASSTKVKGRGKRW